MGMILPLLLAAAQAPAPAAGPDWRLLGTVAGARFALFYDGARIERGAGDLITVRTRRQGAAAPETQPRSVSRVEIQCLARMVRVVETVTRGADGSIIHTDTVPQPFESIPAGSIVETIHRNVC